jgi:hypothetical protein
VHHPLQRLVARCVVTVGISLSIPCYVSAQQASDLHVSPNVPLDSSVYQMLDKLDGLGYLKDMRPNAKPYTRMQTAQWVQQINDSMNDRIDTPGFAKVMVKELNTEFRRELMLLTGEQVPGDVALRDMTVSHTYYKGATLPHQGTASTYQPLNINNNGIRYTPGANTSVALRVEGELSDDFVISATPRIMRNDDDTANFSWESGYLKTHIRNLEIQVGKDPMWWGPGLRGSLPLTNNAAPITGIKLSTIDPIKARGFFKPLREVNINSFYGEMEDTRVDVNSPGFFGLRTDVVPGRNTTIGAALTSMMGGAGHEMSWGDFWDFITGTNANTHGEEKWNSIGGFDFRVRLPKLNGLQIYGELYGEDQAHGLIPLPSKNSEQLGVYIPRLTPSGNWDANIEWASTNRSWYDHWVYTDGYTYEGDIIGDAMGWNARRYYARFTHYSDRANPLALHLEHVTQDAANPAPQEINAAWITKRNKISTDTTLGMSAGLARVKNAHYTAGNNQHNYLFQADITQKF